MADIELAPVDSDAVPEQGAGADTEPALPVWAELADALACPIDEFRGQLRAFVERDRLVDTAQTLRDMGYWQCVDLCAVDYLAHPGRTLPAGVMPERFELVLNLIAHRSGVPGNGTGRLRLRVQVPEQDATAPSLFGIWPGVDQMEREAFDMFGIDFVGHPGLTRILMPDAWQGHPLRKDFAVGAIPVQFKAGGGAR
jgi:NADH-quinone oxidoreductase subunit C